MHIYSSTALFALLVLFCVSGLVLNHVSWLANDKTDGQLEQPLPAELQQSLKQDAQAALPQLTLYLTKQFNLEQPKSVEWDEEEILLDYPLPAGFAYVIVEPAPGLLSLGYQKGGFLTLIGDLHKGRHTGDAWAWVIDLSAVLMVLFAITGCIILLQNRNKRRLGLWLTALGLVTPWLIYLLFVPRLTGVS